MKKTIKAIFTLLSLAALFMLVSKGMDAFKSHKKNPPPQIVEYKPFVIVIPSYNNSAYCERNLRSVFDQKYDNYRIIYIDDCSTDDTYQRVQNFIRDVHQEKRVTLIHNETNRGALWNLYYTIQACNNHEIVVTLDGDDFLAHENVLNKLNRVYANEEVWMTYGNFVDYPTYTQKPVTCKKIPNRVIQKNSYRKHEWITSHLRTFYAGLFKKIKLQHLLYNGRFFPMAWDLALILPMLEMSGKHAAFIRDVLYLYNRSNPLNDHKVNVKLQSNCAEYARRITQYPRLKQLDINKEPESEQQTDLLIFSENNPRQLRALLESVERYASHLDKIFVVYSEEDAFAGIREDFPQIRFISYSDQPNEEFRMLVLKTISSASSSDYIVCSTSEMILTEHVDFNACIQALHQTGAYGFYLSYGSKPIPYHLPIQNSKENLIDAWQFQIGFNEWKCAHTLKMALYSKNVVKKSLWTLPFHDLTSLQERWAARGRPHKVGLFYTHPKAVSQVELERAF